MRLRFLIAAILAVSRLQAATFEIVTVQEAVPESNPVTRTRVITDKTEFSFVAPDQWRPTADAAARRFALQCHTNQTVITIQLLTNAYPASIEKFRDMIASNFTDIADLETYTAASGSGPGFAADFRNRVAEKFTMNTRIALFPAKDGSAEVTISSPTLSVAQLHPIWTGLIGTFKVEPRSLTRK
jgi:hypothetical protein